MLNFGDKCVPLLDEVAVSRCSPNPERSSEFSNRLTCGGKTTELLLPLSSELVGLGRRQPPGAAGLT